MEYIELFSLNVALNNYCLDVFLSCVLIFFVCFSRLNLNMTKRLHSILSCLMTVQFIVWRLVVWLLLFTCNVSVGVLRSSSGGSFHTHRSMAVDAHSYMQADSQQLGIMHHFRRIDCQRGQMNCAVVRWVLMR